MAVRVELRNSSRDARVEEFNLIRRRSRLTAAEMRKSDSPRRRVREAQPGRGEGGGESEGGRKGRSD